MLIRKVATATCLCIVMGLLGCKKSPSIKTVPVSGTVKYKDQPVSGAIVSFLKTADSGKNASGVTDFEGKFTLKSYLGGEKSQDGAVEGTYTVTVALPATPERPFGTPGPGVDPSSVSPDQMKAMREKLANQRPGTQDPKSQKEEALEAAKSSLPTKYAGVDTTPFKDKSVKAGEKNDFELVLEDD